MGILETIYLQNVLKKKQQNSHRHFIYLQKKNTQICTKETPKHLNIYNPRWEPLAAAD